jgi:dipeptidyl aminopeptidase/acylaminoacyl peptidase
LDIADPHFLVQYLAASGYAVFRVNYRTADKYGAWLPERAVLGWRQAVSDLHDAAEYLVDEGIARPDAICAVGRDLGAYMAMMTAIEYPGDLACVVGIGALAEPLDAPGTSLLYVLGGESNDIRVEGSPLRRRRDMDTPTLLFAGRYDGVVAMERNSEILSSGMSRAGADVQFIEYVYTRHDIEKRDYRVDMLTRIGSYLGDWIGGAD